MITILGASGFIGRRLVEKLRDLKIDFLSPARDEELSERPLGNIIYCIGLTADFRSRPFDTVEAHVCKLREVLEDCRFDSLLYLSSARIYDSSSETQEEAAIRLNPLQANDLYNISKAMGEALVFSSGQRARVARLSNVYGDDFSSDNFLSSIIRDALLEKKITLQSSLDSEKDYVSIDDVADVLIKIASGGRERVYNLASGTNVSNFDLIQRIQSLTGCEAEVAPGAPRMTFAPINIDRIKEEFDFKPSSVLAEMDGLIEMFRTKMRERG